ncbi:MAG: lipopolysaccharide biosynthesis protein [Mediterranea sp.]|jgi:O-antigen/teichoic acid export membrane protein|nr:lipopolysaccharide biosynthesis protein [Mediterranea sp.]
MSELKQRTAHGLMWGGINNGVQLVLNAVFGVVLARILNSEDYGMVGQLAIFTAIANTLQDSGFTTALANRREVRHEDYNAVFWFSTLMGVGMYLLLFFCAPFIADFYGNPQVTPLARYLFLGFLLSSISIAQNAYLFRHLMVKQRAMAQLPALFLSGSIGIVLAWNGMTYWGIATQTLTYIGFTTLFYWHFSPWRPTLRIDFRPLKEMFGFSSKMLVTNLFVQLNANVVSALLGRLYTEKEVGYYTQGNKWHSMAAMFITGMIGNVAQPTLAEVSDNRDRQRAVFRKMLRFAAFLSFPMMLGLALIAREFIVIVIGDKWLDSVPILQMLCVWGAFAPLSSIYTNLILSKGKSDIYMWSIIVQCCLQLIGILLVYPYGVHAIVALSVTINVSWILVWHYFVRREIGLSLWHALKDMLPFLFITLLTLGVSRYATLGIHNAYLLFVAKIGIAIPLYIALMWLSNAKIFRESVSYLQMLKGKRAL